MRRGSRVALGGDGQVTLGNIVVKATARKVRKLYHDQVLAGFAGATADAFTLFERFEAKLEKHQGHLVRAAIELTQGLAHRPRAAPPRGHARGGRQRASLIITGNGDVLEPEHGIVSIGSGGAYAQAAARALLEHTELAPREMVKKVARDRRRTVHLHEPEPHHRDPRLKCAGPRAGASPAHAIPAIERA